MRFIYTGDFWVRKTNTIYPQQMFQRYPEVFIVGTGRKFWSSEFMFLTERPHDQISYSEFWKLQGDILGSIA